MSKHITQEQRYYISQRLSNLVAVEKIAQELKIHKSSIYRELARNADEFGKYYCGTAQLKSELRRTKASARKRFLQFTTQVKDYVVSYLKDDWSPEQISGRMKMDIKQTVSHQTIIILSGMIKLMVETYIKNWHIKVKNISMVAQGNQQLKIELIFQNDQK